MELIGPNVELYYTYYTTIPTGKVLCSVSVDEQHLSIFLGLVHLDPIVSHPELEGTCNMFSSAS